jgi:NAD(P)-dependent dehydrogenase (short-subunit alcohol dehydrogenase family)
VTSEIVASGGTALAACADVSIETEVVRLFDTVDRALGPWRALVTTRRRRAPDRVEHMDAARLSRLFAINVTGSFLCAREAVRRMSILRGGNGGRSSTSLRPPRG